MSAVMKTVKGKIMSEQDQKSQDNKPVPVTARREGSDFGPSAGLVGGDVDLQVRTAKEFPRSVGKSKELAMTLATLDKEVAAACIYAVPRAGKVIEGPSTRLAEIMAGAWGNLRVAAKTVGEDDKFVYAQAIAWDLENNTAISYETRRKITTREGQRYNDDMIAVTSNAVVSIALRNVVFRIIPRAYVNEIYMAARKAAAGSARTLKQQRVEIFSFFEEKGIAEQQILDLLSLAKIDDVTLDHLATLKGIATSMKEGLVSVETIFRSGNKQDGEASAEEKGLAAEKDRLLAQIRDELIKRWPSESKENKDEKKVEIKLVFGCETWKEVSSLPNHILGAGLKVVRERAAGKDFFDEDESTAGDIPF